VVLLRPYLYCLVPVRFHHLHARPIPKSTRPTPESRRWIRGELPLRWDSGLFAPWKVRRNWSGPQWTRTNETQLLAWIVNPKRLPKNAAILQALDTRVTANSVLVHGGQDIGGAHGKDCGRRALRSYPERRYDGMTPVRRSAQTSGARMSPPITVEFSCSSVTAGGCDILPSDPVLHAALPWV
jgi:hypothetical protein